LFPEVSSTTFQLQSRPTGTNYRIFVEAPDDAAEPGPYPAVLFMDGDDQFKFAVAAYRALRAANGVPPLLLAGVGYGASYTKPENKRLRDYTPTNMATEPQSGGVDVFLDFLTGSLWPELATRYPVKSDARGLAGHSLGSLAVLHALFRPQFGFTRFLASAPSIWWDDRSLLQQVTARRSKSPELPARLYLSVGMDDTPSMTGDLDLFEQQLVSQRFVGLELNTRRFPQRDHYNVLPDAFRDGLKALYA
jgi:hypothetical protein